MTNRNQSENIFARTAVSLRLAWHYLLILTASFAYLYRDIPIISPIPALLFVFVLFFFRNPKRNIPEDKNLILSPADGIILEIEETFEDKFIMDKTIRVAIFLSIFNVHINRSPLKGEVKYRHYRPGKFIPAFKSHASEINEKNFIGIESNGFKIMVCQITGFIARRIKCWVNEGNVLSAGDIIGIIKFGSGNELFLPPGTKILVKKGERVKAGETVIGILPDEIL
ncbi:MULTISPECIES: phosphatidylserine decarboxylase family protein [Pelotomaculum]|uniref:phosphatidylserine decarboxylase family protein n=1 Tax=Pelotomaculum TaxID=191373 RepID=UPI0009C6F879|nr:MULTISPECIES: phosphatidylserine decarboxylase family protein [Pelotomaculum]OPX87595.1 MAG: phosphatidylserine decarboxylase [Pelotomaculum sp. PtaB.Bin117]OPY60673.1 MAG: phosphatidylserine decarboxylase [Pelotomaculum sp. PtaU1.Bin065]